MQPLWPAGRTRREVDLASAPDEPAICDAVYPGRHRKLSKPGRLSRSAQNFAPSKPELRDAAASFRRQHQLSVLRA